MKNLCVSICVCAVLAVSGCGLTKKDLGMSREGPDASAVKTNTPLILPPEYNVRPQQVKKTSDLTDTAIDE